MLNQIQQDCATVFNKNVSILMTKAEKKSRDELEIAQLQRLKKLILLSKSTHGDHALIDEASPFMISYADRILEPDAEKRDLFFLTIDAREECRRMNVHIDKKYEFIIQLIDSIRKQYVKIDRREKDEIYALVNEMFRECCKYQQQKSKK